MLGNVIVFNVLHPSKEGFIIPVKNLNSSKLIIPSDLLGSILSTISASLLTNDVLPSSAINFSQPGTNPFNIASHNPGLDHLENIISFFSHIVISFLNVTSSVVSDFLLLTVNLIVTL